MLILHTLHHRKFFQFWHDPSTSEMWIASNLIKRGLHIRLNPSLWLHQRFSLWIIFFSLPSHTITPSHKPSQSWEPRAYGLITLTVQTALSVFYVDFSASDLYFHPHSHFWHQKLIQFKQNSMSLKPKVNLTYTIILKCYCTISKWCSNNLKQVLAVDQTCTTFSRNSGPFFITDLLQLRQIRVNSS